MTDKVIFALIQLKRLFVVFRNTLYNLVFNLALAKV